MAEKDTKNKIKIAIIAGEISGDELGAPLMRSLKSMNPSIEFIGVGGPKMISEGLDSHFDISEISVMGIIEPLLNLRRLLKLRKGLKEYFIQEEPDLFIGIDSPDFNLPIAKFLKKSTGIKSIQYVSPSVWAWRKGRIKSMEDSVDLVLTLFPFEESAYIGSKIKVSYVGHPLSYKIKMSDKDIQNKITNSIAFLPGSRKSEIKLIGDIMIKAAKELKQINPEYQFFMPLSNEAHLSLFQEEIEDLITISFSNSQEVLKKSEIAIITSGTATLESILAFTPCLALYKTNWLSYLIIKPLLSIDYFSLPNLIAHKKILPELLQKDVTIKNIIHSINSIRQKSSEFYTQKFSQIQEDLKAGGADKASLEVLKLLN